MGKNNKTLLILGGYGNVGRPLAQCLLQETDVCLVLAGRNREKAEETAIYYNRLFDGNRVEARYADASDMVSLKKAFEGIDLVIVASSTVQFTREVAATALASGIDYMDVQYATEKLRVLKALSNEIKKAGRCFITEGGFHPGLPAALIHSIAQQFDCLKTAHVGSVIKLDWANLVVADSTVYELVEEMNAFQAIFFTDGQWKTAQLFGMTDSMTMDFGREFGTQDCMPMFLEEMRCIPESYPSLKETGFFVGGFNWFVDWLILPLAVILPKISRGTLRPLGKVMAWGLRTFSKPPYGTVLKVEASGEKNDKVKTMDVTLYHQDAYMLTAIPTAACLLQYLSGCIAKPGLWMQANVVEPNQLLKDMARMGIDIQVCGSTLDEIYEDRGQVHLNS